MFFSNPWLKRSW